MNRTTLNEKAALVPRVNMGTIIHSASQESRSRSRTRPARSRIGSAAFGCDCHITSSKTASRADFYGDTESQKSYRSLLQAEITASDQTHEWRRAGTSLHCHVVSSLLLPHGWVSYLESGPPGGTDVCGAPARQPLHVEEHSKNPPEKISCAVPGCNRAFLGTR